MPAGAGRSGLGGRDPGRTGAPDSCRFDPVGFTAFVGQNDSTGVEDEDDDDIDDDFEDDDDLDHDLDVNDDENDDDDDADDSFVDEGAGDDG